jgi:hypothetical protein
MLQNFYVRNLRNFLMSSVCPWQAFRAYFNKHSSLVRTPDFIQQVPPLSSVQAKWVQSKRRFEMALLHLASTVSTVQNQYS